MNYKTCYGKKIESIGKLLCFIADQGFDIDKEEELKEFMDKYKRMKKTINNHLEGNEWIKKQY